MAKLSDLPEMAESMLHQQAVSYWGPERLVSADGTATHMRDLLITSIVHAFSDGQLDGIGPEAFQEILQFFDLSSDMTIPDTEGTTSQPSTGSLDRLAEKYYCVMHVQHWHIARGRRNIPVVGLNGLSTWITMQACSDPAHAGKSLDALLQNSKNPLLDPETDAPFRHQSIPIEVLPLPHDGVRAVYDDARREWESVQPDMLLRLIQKPTGLGLLKSFSNMPPKEECAGHTKCKGVLNPVGNTQQHMSNLSEQTAQNIQRMQMSSLEARLAAQNAWNARQNMAYMSWGNF